MAARSRPRLLPPLELEVMKALWRFREATVRQVHEQMSRRRALAYTTVMTLLDRLARKGAAARRKQGRAYMYHPLVTRQAALDLAVDRLAEDFFDGSREGLLAHLGGAEVIVAEPGSEEALDAVLL